MQAMAVGGACVLAVNIPIMLIGMYYWCAGGSERSHHEPRQFVSSRNKRIKIWVKNIETNIVIIVE